MPLSMPCPCRIVQPQGRANYRVVRFGTETRQIAVALPAIPLAQLTGAIPRIQGPQPTVQLRQYLLLKRQRET